MVLRATLVLTVVTSLAAVGCGGGDSGPEKDVKDAVLQWVSDAETGNAEGLCRSSTRRDRELFDVLARGRLGPKGDCAALIDKRIEETGTGGLDKETAEAIDEADVDVKGDVARIKDPKGDTLTLRRSGRTWQVEMTSIREIGYSAKASAACTQNQLDALERPLPKPTRPGIAREGELLSRALERLARTVSGLEPPRGMEDEHERLVRVMRANAAEWERAAKGVRGLGAPLATYNRSARNVLRRTKTVVDEIRALKIGCAGSAATVRGGRPYALAATKVCRRALARVKRFSKSPTSPQQLTDIGADTSRQLLRIKAPPGLAPLHRRTASAVRASYAQITKVATSSTSQSALSTQIDLLALRPAIGFVRLGLETCAQL